MKVNKPLVFLVEDSNPYRILLKRVLERAGFFVLAFRDGVEAFKKLYDYSPQVIISDIQMPKMDGFELNEATTNHFPKRDIPFIYITSTLDEKNREKADSLGAKMFYRKPIDIHELVGSITKIIDSEVA